MIAENVKIALMPRPNYILKTSICSNASGCVIVSYGPVSAAIPPQIGVPKPSKP